MADLSQDEIDALISGALIKEAEGVQSEGGEKKEATDSGGAGAPGALPGTASAQAAGSTEAGANAPSSAAADAASQLKQERRKRVLSTEAINKPVSFYDFNKPSPIPEEQKKMIALLHEVFAQKLSVNVAAFLRTEAEVELQNVEQLTFSEYVASLNSPTVITSYDMQPLNGLGLLEVNAVLAYSVIDRMLGGDGSVPAQVRPFTDVEVAIIQKFTSLLLLDLAESWQSILKIRFTPKDLQTNPAMVRMIPLKEICIIITLSVRIADISGLLTLCVPYSNLEPIAFKLGSQPWTSFASKQSEEMQELQKKHLLDLPLDVKAVFAQMDMGVHEIMALQVGDIVDLGKRTKDPIIIQVEGSDKFEANPGLLGKYKAFIIQKELTKE